MSKLQQRLISCLQDRPFDPPATRRFNSGQVGSRSISPTMSMRSSKSGRTLHLHRTATSPAPFRPSSSEVALSQDSAFPVFPTNKSRSATPTTPSDPTRSFTADRMTLDRRFEDNAPEGPPSPKRHDSSILQRMNTIAPGPFNVNDPGRAAPSTHHRTGTTFSNKDFVRSSGSSNGSNHSRQPSIAPSLSTIAGGPRSTVPRIIADSPTIPALPPFSTSLSRSPERIQSVKPSRTTEALNHRSQTHPLESEQDSARQKEKRLAATRRPSESAVAAVMKPLNEIGSASTFKSSKSLKGRMAPVVSTTGAVDQMPKDNVPGVPKSTRVQNLGHMNPYHTPTESTSSNESSASDPRSVSSRSTPPLSGSPQREKRRPSQSGHIDNLLQEFRFGTEQVPVIEEPVPRHRAAAPSIRLPVGPDLPDPQPPCRDPAVLSPYSSTHPDIKRDRPVPVQAPSDYNAPTVPLQNGNLRLSLAPPPPPAVPVSPLRKPTAANKGKCRGCSEFIKGKSVSSADGRLTGRYHRSCFVCKTCREPFQTADFYVLDNHPFCARHYHELNGSLCKTCDKGIEGQYLETESKQKFHPYCFTCQVSVSLNSCNNGRCTNPSPLRTATRFYATIISR